MRLKPGFECSEEGGAEQDKRSSSSLLVYADYSLSVNKAAASYDQSEDPV